MKCIYCGSEESKVIEDAVEKALNAINKNSDLLKNGINKIDKITKTND